MAQRTIVLLEDDLDGSNADETVAFGFDGRSYEIDLSAKNASSLRKILEPYVSAARKVNGRSAFAVRGRAGSNSGPDAATLRAWAIENGYEVNTRGRVSAAIREAYENR
jgi:hypothetical protein